MKNKVLKDVLDANGVGIIGIYLVMFIELSVAYPNFLEFSNTMIGIRQTAYTAIVASAVTFVISLGEISLSAGSTVGISGMVLTAMILGGYNIHLAIGVVILLGAFIGLINGLLMTRLRTAYFIAILGIISILRGLVYVYTRGVPLYGFEYSEIRFMSQGHIGVVLFPIIPALIILLVCYYFFHKTKFGGYTVFIDSNEDVAKLVRINVDKVKILVFMLSRVLYAIVGMILAPRSKAAVLGAGNAYEMNAIATIAIGGASISGGKGNMVGTAFRAILMATIKNGLNLLNVSIFWHQVVAGTLILFAVALDGYALNRATRDG